MDYATEFSELIETVIKHGASDLHLTMGRSPTMRVSGALVSIEGKKMLSAEDTKKFAEVLLVPKNREIFFARREIDFSYTYQEKVRFRCNGFFQQGNIGFALRLIPRYIRTIEELNLPSALKKFTEMRQGFFLVVGPVGQGKTTTLAAMIDLINSTRAEHIITIEDPIEYLFESKKSIVDQREVRVDTENFHSALISAFREDVNVIMVGEMRGLETIATAVTAAETGHLVLATLHTNNAAQTIDRIIDSFPPGQQEQIRVQLAGSLAGIFSQRLIPALAGGLTPAYELLVNTPAASNLIREGRTHEIQTIIETGTDHGMIDLNRSLAELVRAEKISLESAYQHALDPKALERLI